MMYCFLCFTSEASFSQSTDTERFALLISANYGGPSRPVLKYADNDARNVAQVLNQLGGIPTHHIVSVTMATVETLQKGLEELTERIRYSRKQKHRIELIIYYSGHSTSDGLQLGEKSLPYTQLKKEIQSLDADVKIAVLDSCASGSLIRPKGVVLKPPFLISSDRESKGQVIITSSSADEVAQESDRIQGSFFTYFFTNGLRGGADANRDLKVTLFEAYDYAYRQTLLKSKTQLMGEQHPSYDFQLSGKGDIVLTYLSQADVIFWFAPDLSGEFFIVGTDGKIQLELAKDPGQPKEIGLPMGIYKVYLSQPGSMSEAQVQAGKDQKVDVASLVYKPVDRNFVVEKGDAGMPHLYKRQIFNLSLYPDIGEQGFIQTEELNHISLGLSVGYSRKLKGFGLGLIGFITEEESKGFEIGGIFNYAKSPFRGFQFAIGFNYAPITYGGQIAFVNLVGTAEGLQVGFFNRAHHVTGGQLGFINMAHEVKGMQIGLLNINESMDDGVPIALLTHSTKGYRGVECFFDPMGIPYLGYTSGTKKFVSRLFLSPTGTQGRGYSWGWRTSTEHGQFNWDIGKFYYWRELAAEYGYESESSHQLWRSRLFLENQLFQSRYLLQWGLVADQQRFARSGIKRDSLALPGGSFVIKNSDHIYSYGSLFLGFATSFTE